MYLYIHIYIYMFVYMSLFRAYSVANFSGASWHRGSLLTWTCSRSETWHFSEWERRCFTRVAGTSGSPMRLAYINADLSQHQICLQIHLQIYRQVYLQIFYRVPTYPLAIIKWHRANYFQHKHGSNRAFLCICICVYVLVQGVQCRKLQTVASFIISYHII